MRWFRIRFVLLGLMLCVVHVLSSTTCGTEFTDAASSALLAQVVIEGKVTKKLEVQKSDRYNVTVQVRRVIKGGDLLNGGKKPRKITVGAFGAENKAECVTEVEEYSKQNKKYYLFFLRKLENEEKYLEVSAFPVSRDKKSSRIVRKILSKRGAKIPKIKRIKNKKQNIGKRFKVNCRASGKPTPKFTWYKDEVLLQSRKGLRIKNGKRGSRLDIKKVDPSDTGWYECVAENAAGQDKKKFKLDINGNYLPCEKQTLCFNGGTCRHIPALNRPYCECPVEWEGSRCEVRDIFSLSQATSRQAKIIHDRTFIIIGICIAILVFVIICIASYFLARRQRKKAEARRRRKQQQNIPLLDEVDTGVRGAYQQLTPAKVDQKIQTYLPLNNHPPPYMEANNTGQPSNTRSLDMLRGHPNAMNGNRPLPERNSRSRLKGASVEEEPQSPIPYDNFDVPNSFQDQGTAQTGNPVVIEMNPMNSDQPGHVEDYTVPSYIQSVGQAAPVVLGGEDPIPKGAEPQRLNNGPVDPRNTDDTVETIGSNDLSPEIDKDDDDDIENEGELTPLYISEENLHSPNNVHEKIKPSTNSYSTNVNGIPWAADDSPSSPLLQDQLVANGYLDSENGIDEEPYFSVDHTFPKPSAKEGSEIDTSVEDSKLQSPGTGPQLCWDEVGTSVSIQNPYQSYRDDDDDDTSATLGNNMLFGNPYRATPSSIHKRLKDVKDDQDAIPV